jgi:hypothetical protein
MMKELENMRYKLLPDNMDVKLPSLVGNCKCADDWESQKEEPQCRILEYLGGLPEQADIRPTIFSKTDMGTYERTHISYGSYDGDRVTAYVLSPKGDGTPKKRPAILALHPTSDLGKDVPAAITAIPGRNYGEELVKRDYIVLVPDVFTAGERVPSGSEPYETDYFYKKYPWWSATGKMLYDHQQGINYLFTLPEVDTDRIGAIGHSLGAINAYFLAAFDKRIKAVVVSCGLSTFTGSPYVFHWSRSEWFTYFKSIHQHLERGYAPFEFHEVLSLIAPRAIFNWSAKADEIFTNWNGVVAIEKRLKEVYRLYGAEENMRFILGDGTHDFPDDIRRKAYEFLDAQLK